MLYIYTSRWQSTICVVAISFRAPSLQLVVYIDNTTAISNDRSPRTWVHSYGSTTRGYIMVQNIMMMRRCDAGRFPGFREFNSIMIIEKLIAVWPRRRSRTKQTLGDLSTPRLLSPRQFIPYVTIFFSSRPLTPSHSKPTTIPRPYRFSIFILPR